MPHLLTYLEDYIRFRIETELGAQTITRKIGIIPRDSLAGYGDIHLNLSVSKEEVLLLLKNGINALL